MTTITNCQICGRYIKSAKGLIAHHGYKRPGQGWQSASCYGARHVPYEVGHDAIDLAIRSTKTQIAGTTEYLAKIRKDPPEKLIWVQKRDCWSRPTYTDVAKPADFDPVKTYKTYRRGDYVTLYHENVANNERDLREMKEFLKYLDERLSAWKAPIAA